MFLDMSNIKKLFAKLKGDVKFAKAGEGHRLNEPSSPPPSISQNVQQSQPTLRQNSASGTAARAAADAAQQRLQSQLSKQQSGASSENE
jgi:hypothetical protein